MKRTILKISIIIILVFIILKIYQFIMLNNFYKAIKELKNSDNRYCCITIKIDNKNDYKENIFVKSNIVKYVKQKENKNLYEEWKDFSTGEEYDIDLKNKVFFTDNVSIVDENFLINMPELIQDFLAKDKIDFIKLMNVKYIIPIKYNNIKCYKISTKNEVIIIDSNTNLPIYSSQNMIEYKADAISKTEKVYEFKVGEVTDKDIELIDLTEYQNISLSK